MVRRRWGVPLNAGYQPPGRFSSPSIRYFPEKSEGKDLKRLSRHWRQHESTGCGWHSCEGGSKLQGHGNGGLHAPVASGCEQTQKVMVMAKRKTTARRASKKQTVQKAEGASCIEPLAEWLPVVDKPHPAWVEFERKHRRHPVLQDDAICAMPDTLINAILCEMPDFFSKKEEQFERDLAQMAGGGFFLQRPFGYPPIVGSTFANSTDKNLSGPARRWRESDKKLKELLAEGMERQGRSTVQVTNYFATQEEISRKIEERKWGYAGWLVTNPEYCAGLAQFRERWEAKIQRIGGFPTLPISFSGNRSPSVPEEEREFYDDYTQFYQHWGLHTLVTWDLPVPMWSGVGKPNFYPLAQVSDSGVVLFIPWYLLRDQSLKLRDLAKHESILKCPDHLQGWLERGGIWGHERLGKMLKIYIHLDLCLKRRYANKIDDNIDNLDKALGHFLGEPTTISDNIRYNEENVKKIRAEMFKRLEGCRMPVNTGQTSEAIKATESEPDAQSGTS